MHGPLDGIHLVDLIGSVLGDAIVKVLHEFRGIAHAADVFAGDLPCGYVQGVGRGGLGVGAGAVKVRADEICAMAAATSSLRA